GASILPTHTTTSRPNVPRQMNRFPRGRARSLTLTALAQRLAETVPGYALALLALSASSPARLSNHKSAREPRYFFPFPSAGFSRSAVATQHASISATIRRSTDRLAIHPEGART